MASRIDRRRASARDRMARQGTDCIADDSLPRGLTPPKVRPSKAALRAELAEATAKITRIVRCAACGHQGTVLMPRSRLHSRLLCSKCGEIGGHPHG